MNISGSGLALIRRFEGFSPTPYRCPANLLTIGYGHVVLPAERTLVRIDEVEGERLLIGDVAFAEAAVRRLMTVPLSQHQFDALVSFTFNVGTAALQRSTLRRIINRGDVDGIASQWMRWVWGGGKKLPGLARRRTAELLMYQG